MTERLTQKQLTEIKSMDWLANQLPINFENGQVCGDLITKCGGCGDHLGPNQIRAKISKFSHSAAIEGYALCIHCKIIMPLAVRCSDDGDMLFKMSDGTWKKKLAPAPDVGGLQGLIQSLSAKLSGLFR